MKYYIRRISSYGPDVKPCANALPEQDTCPWNRSWCIQIDTVDDLIALISEVGEIIMGGDYITIYDDYNE